MVQTVHHFLVIPQLQLDFWWSIPVVRVVQILRCRPGEDIRAPTVGFTLQKTAEIPQSQFIKVVDTPFVTWRLISMVLFDVDKAVDAPIFQGVPVARVSKVLVVKITVVIPQLQHIEKSFVDKVVHTPVVCNDKSSTSLS